MANIAGAYDPNAEASGDFDPLPAGEYRAKIIESDIEDVSKTNNYGRCLKLTWQVETDQFDGRLFWQRLNMWGENMNNNDKVVSIAQSQFAAIRQATGKPTPQNSEELHHIPCLVRIKVKTDPNGQYGHSNEVTSVKSASGAAPVGNQQKFTAPQQQGKPAGGSAPWPRKSA